MKEITELESEFDVWRKQANKDSLWLFLATFGCWSVPHGGLRYISFILVFAIFLWYLHNNKSDKTSFPDKIKKINDLIVRQEAEDQLRNKEKLQKLIMKRMDTRVGKRELILIRDYAIFVISFFFWAVSAFLDYHGVVK